MLLKFGKEIGSIKEVHQNGFFFIYFGGFKHLDGYYLMVCCSLDPVLVIYYVILVILCKFNSTFQN